MAPLHEAEKDATEYDMPLSMLVRQLIEAGAQVTEEEVTVFVGTEENLQTPASTTYEEIPADVMTKQDEPDEVELDDEDDTVTPPTLAQCLKWQDACRQCYMRQKTPEPLLAQLSALEALTEKSNVQYPLRGED